MVLRSALFGMVMMVATLLVFTRYFWTEPERATTVALTVLAAIQWFNAWNCRSARESAFRTPFSNPFLVLALVAVVTLHILAVYVPFMQSILFTVPLAASDWVLAVGVSLSIVIVEEIRKAAVRRFLPAA
jgi:Ca2+-transporting ATPase